MTQKNFSPDVLLYMKFVAEFEPLELKAGRNRREGDRTLVSSPISHLNLKNNRYLFGFKDKMRYSHLRIAGSFLLIWRQLLAPLDKFRSPRRSISS